MSRELAERIQKATETITIIDDEDEIKVIEYQIKKYLENPKTVEKLLKIIDRIMDIADNELISRGQYISRQVYLSDIMEVFGRKVEEFKQEYDR